MPEQPKRLLDQVRDALRPFGRHDFFVLHERPHKLKNNIDFGFVFVGRAIVFIPSLPR